MPQVPPIATVDETTDALALRKRFLKALAPLPVTLQRWVVDSMVEDVAKRTETPAKPDVEEEKSKPASHAAK